MKHLPQKLITIALGYCVLSVFIGALFINEDNRYWLNTVGVIGISGSLIFSTVSFIIFCLVWIKKDFGE